MKAMMLRACLAVPLYVVLGGGLALAQPGDGYQSQTDPYYDQPPPPQSPQPAPNRGYQGDDQADNGYGGYQPPPPPPAGQPGFQNYQGSPPSEGYPTYERAYQPPPQRWSYGGGRYYTGRVGRAWRNSEGQVCRWRQLSWQDAYGRQAYQWVPRCRGD